MRCRCTQHGWPDGTGEDYVAKVDPAGQSNDAVICGRCTTPGALYLTIDEYYQFRYDARRIYPFDGEGELRIKLSDDPVDVKESRARAEENPPT